MIRGIVVLALLGVAFASRSANQYIENVLHTTLPNELRQLGLNPAALPAFTLPISYQPFMQANFINGNATGLALVKRKSECQGPKMVYGELTINCTLSLYPITTNYAVRVTNGSRVYNVRSTGYVGETLVDVVIAGRPQNYVGSVKRFQVQRVGQIRHTFSGLPQAFSKYVNSLESDYTASVTNYLYNILQHNYGNAIGRAIAYIPMPRQ